MDTEDLPTLRYLPQIYLLTQLEVGYLLRSGPYLECRWSRAPRALRGSGSGRRERRRAKFALEARQHHVTAPKSSTDKYVFIEPQPSNDDGGCLAL